MVDDSSLAFSSINQSINQSINK